MTAVPDSNLRQLIERARDGDEEALGQALQQHRPYLRLLAQRVVSGPLAARLDPSDVIQQTLLSAIREFPAFNGREPGEFLAWLVRMHERNLQDAVREHVVSQKRGVGREGSQIEETAFIDTGASSPSARLLQGERAVHLAQALESLPDDQREAVRLRHLEGLSLAQMAARLARSERAVAALLNRGIVALRSRMRRE